MVKCHCLKIDGKSCTRKPSTKFGDDRQYCWQHQGCKNPIIQQSSTFKEQISKVKSKTKPLPLPKKKVTEEEFNNIVKSGNIETIKSIKNLQSLIKNTSIEYYAGISTPEMFQFLVDHGLQYSDEILLRATLENNPNLVKYLIEKLHVQPDIRYTYWGEQGRTALHIASGQCNLPLVKYFVENQLINIDDKRYYDYRDKFGGKEADNQGIYHVSEDADNASASTPLLDAVYNECHEVAEYLIDQGANYNYSFNDNTDEGDYDAVERAVINGDLPMIQYFIETIGIDIEDAQLMDLLEAKQNTWKNPEVKQYLLKKGVRLKQSTETPQWDSGQDETDEEEYLGWE